MRLFRAAHLDLRVATKGRGEIAFRPCRFGRRYDRRQRTEAWNALHEFVAETAVKLGMKPVEVQWPHLDAVEIIDAVAWHLGLWMSPETRDQSDVDIELWTMRRHRRA